MGMGYYYYCKDAFITNNEFFTHSIIEFAGTEETQARERPKTENTRDTADDCDDKLAIEIF